MSTKPITTLNGRTDLPIIKHEQFKAYLLRNFSLDEESAKILDEILIKLVTLVHRVQWLEKKQEEFEAKPLCSGVPYWPKDNEGYLKCNHGVGQECPIHGKPKGKRKRLRVGVGRSAKEINRVLQAIEDYSAYQSTLRELSAKRDALRSMQHKLMNSIGIYRR